VETENQYIEKRKYSRQLFYDNVYLTNEGGAYLGTALNYSSGGIYITTDRAVNIGDVLFISFPRPENMDRMSKETAVVVRKERNGFALEFLERAKKAEKPAEFQDAGAIKPQ
jgi:hypothetical protein